MSLGKRVFVTVGTTEFNKLIEIISQEDILDVLYELDFNTVQFQTGQGKFTPRSHPELKLLYTQYFEHFADEIDKSNLVISHAGAGTCLDVLRRNKALIVVVNEDLMDNHQTELAEQLEESGYVYSSTINNLKEVLKRDIAKLKQYPVPNVKQFSNYLDRCVGFMEQ